MEKTISVRRTTITFSIWDLGGQREFVNMLPLVCNDAVAILFMFDLSRKSTLNSVKEWYRQARGFNKVCDCRAFKSSESLRLVLFIFCTCAPTVHFTLHFQQFSFGHKADITECSDCYTISYRHEIRYFCNLSPR